MDQHEMSISLPTVLCQHYYLSNPQTKRHTSVADIPMNLSEEITTLK